MQYSLKIRGMEILRVVALATSFLGASTLASRAVDPAGTWYSDKGAMSVTGCGGGLCATIVSLKEPNDPQTGKPKTDSQNADPSKRNRPLVGVQVFAMQPQGPNKWSGRLYNYQDGKTYEATVFMEGANTLKMQGCVLFVCQTRTLTRGPPVTGWDDGGQSAPAPRDSISSGTGFFISGSGHIVTNAHVVQNCRAVRSSRGAQIRKVSIDEQSDLALYLASENQKHFARLRGGYGARVGETVVAVGFPLPGLLSPDPIVTTGIISALSGLRNDRRTIQTTAPVQPGNSGGPLLGENGSVVGVVVGKLNAMKMAQVIGDIPQNVNFAISLGTLQSFLNSNGASYLLDDSKATKSPSDIAAEASLYTARIECLR
jgi:uncharacterized protein (DUF2147 family)